MNNMMILVFVQALSLPVTHFLLDGRADIDTILFVVDVRR